jgi:glutamate/tyrosine decarboxylase-like PLP-dependent enzyme
MTATPDPATLDALLRSAAECSLRYLDAIPTRRVTPTEAALAALDRLGGPLPDAPGDPMETLALLDEVGSPATVASTGGRYFGFVTGGALPATVACNWLAGAWDQNAGAVALAPGCAALEEAALQWVLDVLGLPAGSGVGFVTGATAANLCGLAAGRHALLERLGWDVEERGLYGAPEITVVVGDEVHVSLLKGLGLLGLGRERVVRVPTDDQGRMRADALPPLSESTIVCVQAGNVNSGAFDPAVEICAAAREAGAWVHVDGAFGLWALASPARAHLARGFEEADSWCLDGHKWLNVPQDCGIAICRDPEHLRRAMVVSAGYLVFGERREPYEYTPEMSRRARGIEVWAALRSLGRSGLAELVDRCCRHASRFADGLAGAGYEILNDVVLNQVLVSFGEPETTRRVIEALQADGTCWCGGTTWHGRTAMRISVSSWATTEEDVEACLGAMLRVAAAVRGGDPGGP